MPPDGGAPGYYGVYPAVVTNIVDDKKLGRVEVRFPWLGTDGNKDVRAWATLCSPYASKDQGFQFMPEKDSHVVVAFEAGNPRRPYVLGAAWFGQEKQPFTAEVPNNIRMLRSREDSRIEFDDTKGAAKVSVTMKSGHEVVLDSAAQEVRIKHSNKTCTIKLTAGGSVTIDAGMSVDIKAPALNVTAGTSSFSGNVECKTLIANAVIMSPVYSPGAGNFL
jgi:uncharacterized protein involved in type VI secretion and phage assembly